MTKRILVIDDEEAVRDAFALALEDTGFHVELATSGEEGLEKAKLSRPDLIFLDLRMPGISGVETLERLVEWDPNFTIYIVTAFYKEYMSELTQARDRGNRFQLAAKPLTSEQIKTIANRVLTN